MSFERLDFAPLRPPFADFLVAVGALGASASPPLPHRLTCAGATVWASADLAMGRALLCGSARIGRRLRLGPVQLSADEIDHEIADPTLGLTARVGQYVAIDCRADRLCVLCDPFGMVPLFAIAASDGALISNRLQLIAQALEQRSGVVEIDPAAAACHLLSRTRFNARLNTFETPVAGVELTPAGAGFVVEAGRARRVDRPRLPFQRIDEDAYVRLVDQGAADIAATVDAALNATERKLLVDVTGGRDSRIVLAALAALGRVGDVVFSTYFAEDVDQQVGTGLVRMFGGRFDDTPPARFRLQSAEEQLRGHRRQYFGLYHSLRRRSAQVGVGAEPVLHLYGGSGELYRSAYSDTLSRFRDADGLAPAPADFARHSIFARPAPPDVVEAAIAMRLRLFDRFEGDLLDEKLDDHYRHFGNRFHFGATALQVGPDDVVKITPLLSLNLLQASRGTPPDVRASGRLCYDVTRALSERVAHAPYAKPQPDYARLPYHRGGPAAFSSDGFAPAPELLAAAAAKQRAVAAPTALQPMSGAEFCAIARDAALAGFDAFAADAPHPIFDRAAVVEMVDGLRRKGVYNGALVICSQLLGLADMKRP